MIWMAVVALIVTVTMMLKRSLWDKLLGLSSLSVKVSILSALVAYSLRKGFLMDVALMYVMASGAGTILFLIFLLRRGEK